MQKNEILVVHGTNPAAMARQLCEAADLAAMIGDREKKVGLKPNLVSARPAEDGATTHPEILAGLIEYLRGNGFENLTILEGSWVGANTKTAFSRCGYEDLSRRYNVPLVDLQRDKCRKHDCKGMQIEMCETAKSMDFMINLPVLKGHCQTLLTCALKNNKGVISNAEKRRFHTMGLHKPIAHLNTVARSDFILVDGICGDLDFEEGGNPVRANRMFAAVDPVLCDAWAARQMGLDLDEVPYIGMAEKLGVGSADLSAASVRSLNDGEAAGAAPMPEGRVRRLARYIREDGACSACYAALVRALNRMDGRLPAGLEVCIGQGWRGQGGALGVGRCTAGFERTCPGCPPEAGDIVDFLRGQH